MKYISMLKNKFIHLFAITIFLSTITASCSLNFSDREYETSIRDQIFIFDPKSVFSSIRVGKISVFTPTDTQSEPLPTFTTEPITWHQADYLQIVEAIHKFVWGESLDKWQLHEMDFSLRCAKAGSGFESGHFQFFKVIKSDSGDEKRIKHEINIDATGHSIFTLESEYKPKLVDWKAIDIAKMKLTADASLQIADADGGKQKRLDIQNQCSIFTLIAPDSLTSYQWLIRYTEYEKPDAIYSIEINPFTGEHRK